MNKNELGKVYRNRLSEINNRLGEFRIKGKGSEEDIFGELCFCLMTPQSRAIAADAALNRLINKDLLFSDDVSRIKPCLTGVRFPNNKASYIAAAARKFNTDMGGDSIKKYLSNNNDSDMRDKLASDIKGLGLKEASHFMRNIGRGSELAILDRHVLKGLKEYGVIESLPKSITPSVYYETEGRMKSFSKSIKIPLEALDLIFWYNQTGYFFR